MAVVINPISMNILENAAGPIIPFMEDGICDEITYKKIATINNENYERLLEFFINQKSPGKNSSYSLYKTDIYSGIFSHHLDIASGVGDSFHATLQCDDRHILLHTLSVDSMMEFLNNNVSQRYVFMPLVFGTEVKEKGHFGVVVFDLKANDVFMLDPNGKTSFFDNIFIEYSKKSGEHVYENYEKDLYIDGGSLVDKLIEGYVNELNFVFDLGLKYIGSSAWNPKTYVINRTFSNENVIGSGHCVAITTMLIHLLHLSDSSVTDVYEKLGKLSDVHIMEIINGYSVGISSMITETH